MRPNGQFIGIDKIAHPSKNAVVYKVTFDQNSKKLTSIKSVINDHPVNENWGLDTCSSPGYYNNRNKIFSEIKISYDGKNNKTYKFYVVSQNLLTMTLVA